MREVIDGPCILHRLGGIVHCLQVIQHHFVALLIRNFLHVLMSTESIGSDHLVDVFSPAEVIDHQMAEAFLDHVVKYIVRDLGMIFRLRSHCLHSITFIIDLGEEFFLIFTGISIVNKTVRLASVAVSAVKRCRYNQLVKLFDFTVYRDEDFAVFPFDFCNVLLSFALCFSLASRHSQIYCVPFFQVQRLTLTKFIVVWKSRYFRT